MERQTLLQRAQVYFWDQSAEKVFRLRNTHLYLKMLKQVVGNTVKLAMLKYYLHTSDIIKLLQVILT